MGQLWEMVTGNLACFGLAVGAGFLMIVAALRRSGRN